MPKKHGRVNRTLSALNREIAKEQGFIEDHNKTCCDCADGFHCRKEYYEEKDCKCPCHAYKSAGGFYWC